MRINILILLLSFSYALNAQTLIATTKDPNAIANHNQRKIVRANGSDKFVVFTDSSENGPVIKGVKYEEGWGEPFILAEGKNPSLGFHYNQYSLAFEREDSVRKIYLSVAYDDFEWSDPICISDTILDCRNPQITSFYTLSYIQKNIDGTESLKEAYYGFKKNKSQTIFNRDTIIDYAIAENLSLMDDYSLFAIQFDNDSIISFWEGSWKNDFNKLYQSTGTFPGATHNYGGYDRILYLNQSNQIVID
ncbi:MAG: hypothetical protein C0599_00305, partial [Salinivirgaceae bacterium]